MPRMGGSKYLAASRVGLGSVCLLAPASGNITVALREYRQAAASKGQAPQAGKNATESQRRKEDELTRPRKGSSALLGPSKHVSYQPRYHVTWPGAASSLCTGKARFHIAWMASNTTSQRRSMLLTLAIVQKADAPADLRSV